jgi:signal transduction histidine kinase
MAAKAKSGSRWLSIGPLHLILICCLIILVLIVNGLFELNRTQESLRAILENQGVTLLRGLERQIQNTVSTIEVMESVPGAHLLNIASSRNFFALEDDIVDYLLKIAALVDENAALQTLSPQELESAARSSGLSRIDILDGLSRSEITERGLSPYLPLAEGIRNMVIVPFKKLQPDKGDLFSVAIRRTARDGIVAVSIDHLQMKNLRRRFAIQDVLETMGFGEGVLYLLVFDHSLLPVAQVKSDRTGKIEGSSVLEAVGGGVQTESRLRLMPDKQEVFEVAKILNLEERPYGVIQVGLSTQEIQSVLSRSRSNVVLSIAVLLALSMAGVTLIYVNQERHLRRLREMEGRAQAAERHLAIGKLGAGLAHEIRNPLNAIGMAIQRLQREFLPRDKTKKKEYGRFMGVIREEITRLNQIVDQFVLFSKPYTLTLASVSLADILGNISVLFAEELKTRSIVMDLEVDPTLPPLKIDKGKITQALINIVTNGLYAMEGGGKLAIQAEIDRRDWVKVTVSDTGKGIPKEEIEKVFDYSYTTREKGLGLGLPIAHKVIEEHGGKITIESQVRKGTTISIYLPGWGP